MSATIVKIEQARDIQKIVLETKTQQDFAEIAPQADLRSWRSEQVDGVYTLVEEKYTDPGIPMWSMDATTSTEPLESHWIFVSGVPSFMKSWWLAWKRNSMDPSLTKEMTGSIGSWWDPAIDGVFNQNFSIFYERWKNGFDSFLSPRVVLRKTELTTDAPSASEVGQISEVQSRPFDVPAGVNFILSSVRSQQEGNYYRTTYEWLGSNANSSFPEGEGGTRGWDTVIYSAS
jgi:hypothetical protein